MASATRDTPTDTNGGSGAATFQVENPATGELIATVPLLGAEQVAELAARGRAAQPGWAALGFDGRARVMKRAQQAELRHSSGRHRDSVEDLGHDPAGVEISRRGPHQRRGQRRALTAPQRVGVAAKPIGQRRPGGARVCRAAGGSARFCHALAALGASCAHSAT